MSALEQAKKAWASGYAGLSQGDIDDRVRGFSALVRLIAKHGVVTPTRFAESVGLEASRAGEILAELGTVGMQTDESGNIIGAALTTRETAHRVRVLGKTLYAWCALDTLFIPGLLEQTADVESVCPTSGEPIRLRIAPDRIEWREPADTWLSVFLPRRSSLEMGPSSPT